MKLETAVRRLIQKHPIMHPYRANALETLYCLLGSGLDWGTDGTIVDCPNNYLDPKETDLQQAQRKIKEYKKSLTECIRLDFVGDGISKKNKAFMVLMDREFLQNSIRYQEDNLKTSRKVLKSWKTRAKNVTNTRNKVYPLSDLSNFTTMPDNVQDDWKQGGIEFAHIVLKTTKSYYPENDKKMTKKNHQFARQFLKKWG